MRSAKISAKKYDFAFEPGGGCIIANTEISLSSYFGTVEWLLLEESNRSNCKTLWIKVWLFFNSPMGRKFDEKQSFAIKSQISDVFLSIESFSSYEISPFYVPSICPKQAQKILLDMTQMYSLNLQHQLWINTCISIIVNHIWIDLTSHHCVSFPPTIMSWKDCIKALHNTLCI